jgi:hypothetical protein
MKKVLMPLVFLTTAAGWAQQGPVKSLLLDHLAGKWVLQGQIAGRETTHDVEAAWDIQHHYLRIHEVSREKDPAGQPQYEATIYVARNESTHQYACVWLDVYGGLTPGSIGLADTRENELPFVFRESNGVVSFSNVFAYDPKNDTWEWRMDNVEDGVVKPFGRVKLTRK